MENLALTLVVYFIGWVFGFATFGFLVWHTVNKMPVPQPIPLKRTNVSDLFPPKDNN